MLRRKALHLYLGGPAGRLGHRAVAGLLHDVFPAEAVEREDAAEKSSSPITVSPACSAPSRGA